MRKLYYGRISTTDGQSSASQYEDARAHGVQDKDVFIDEGVSGYHVAPDAREQWRKAEHDLRHGGTLIVRWFDRISRRYDELHATMRRLMELGVRVECPLNGMVFDGKAKDPIEKATRDAILAFMDRIKARQVDIERAVFDANAKFALVIAHTGQEQLGAEVSDALANYVAAQNDTSELMFSHVLTQGDLHKAVAAGLAGTPITLEVQLAGWGQLREPHFAIYGQVCAADVAVWSQAHGNRLFETNLRQFLGSSTVNQDIVATLVERPLDFWYFNNGITAVATDVAKKPIGGNSTESGIFECAGFCVVNGAQTVGSIHAASLQNAEAVAKAMVPIRIISSANSPHLFASEVTRCTNTQNAIEKRDFVALDPEQERIRQELHIENVEYAYKAGTATGAAGNRFDLTEATVALACASSDVGMAVQAKREISKLWDDIGKAPYKQLFNAGVPGPFIWEVVQALRAVDASLQAEAKQCSGRDALICVHGNRFIQWGALKSLQIKQGDLFSNVASSVPDVVKSTLKSVITAVKEDYSDSYPASLFKNLGKC